LKLADIWRALVGDDPAPLGPLAEEAITTTVVDSRAAQPGSLFVALRGERTNGNLYVADAFTRGAVVAIAEVRATDLPGAWVQVGAGDLTRSGSPMLPFTFIVPDALAALQRLAGYWRAQTATVAVGITGSIGKTTTKEIVANVLAQRYKTLWSEGNLNNEIGLPLTLLRLTPDHQRVVLEMGMYAPGEITRLCELARPRIGSNQRGPYAPGTPGQHRTHRSGQVGTTPGAPAGRGGRRRHPER
jgi:UDP-N-acetylmuramoyl-tripeptide--D-alanyl-D-alanine ligase